jgi:hypothetical protein
MKTVHLKIDRIAVEGLDAARQRQFAHSLEEQLRQWAARGVAGGAEVKIATLNAGLLRPGATAGQAARQVVKALAQRVGAGGTGGKEARGHV